MKLILTNVRSSHERRADFEAQIGSLKTGEMRLLEIVERRGEIEARDYAAQLISYSARMMRTAIAAIPDGTYTAEDALDDDGIVDNEIPIGSGSQSKVIARWLTLPAVRRRWPAR
jgi:N-methylhydantoinase B